MVKYYQSAPLNSGLTTQDMSMFWQVLYFMTAGLMLAVAILVYIQKPERPEIRAFVALMIAIIGWVVTLDMFYVLINSEWLILVGRANYLFGELVVLSGLAFIYYFPGKASKVPEWSRWLVISTGALLAIVTMTTDLIDQYEEVAGVNRVTHPGPLLWFYTVFVAVVIGLGIAMLVQKIRETKLEHRRQFMYFGIAWSVGIVGAFGTNLVIPMMTGNQELYRWGPFAAMYFTVLFVYAIVKYEGLIDLKLLSVEVLVSAVVLLFFLNLALSVSTVDQIIGTISLLAGCGLGYLLLYNFRQEVKRRRLIEEMADELQEANRQLHDLSEAKSEFISIASHQLRTPVSVIKGYLSLIRDGAYGPIAGTLKEKLDQMFEMNERLVHLISNLLNLTRLEKGRIEYFCSEIDVAPLISQSVDEMMLEVNGKQLQIEYEQPERALPKIWADPDKLHEVIVNLIDNAIKYTPAGTIRIAVEIDHIRKQVVIRVADSGIGMQKEDLEHVFEKFFQPQKENPTRQAGMSMGLGLYICSKFMHGMGGDIWVEQTSPGHGTTMALSLPTEPGGVCALESADGPQSMVPVE